MEPEKLKEEEGVSVCVLEGEVGCDVVTCVRIGCRLADVISSSPTLSADDLENLKQDGGYGEGMFGGDGGGGEGGGGGGDRAGPTVEQRRLLEEGVHPSQIPGLEDGIEIEIGDDRQPRIISKQEL